MAGRTKLTTPTFISNRKKIKVGDSVTFTRKKMMISGEVIQIGENTVMVKVDESTRRLLEISTNETVVNHKNYTIHSLPILRDYVG